VSPATGSILPVRIGPGGVVSETLQRASTLTGIPEYRRLLALGIRDLSPSQPRTFHGTGGGGIIENVSEGHPIGHEWRGPFRDEELDVLHAHAFDLLPTARDWNRQLRAHSLGWVTATRENQLLGFVNVAWDGSSHAFLLDTVVAPDEQRRGIGEGLVHTA